MNDHLCDIWCWNLKCLKPYLSIYFDVGNVLQCFMLWIELLVKIEWLYVIWKCRDIRFL